MAFEWDETKRQRNVEKHGIDFLIATQLFDGRPVVTHGSPRAGEERWATIGELNGKLVVVVWARRGDNCRIISVRRARTSDERDYRQVHG